MTLAASQSRVRSIRAGRGLGDSLYLQSVARSFVECGAPLKVLTDWPDVFGPLAGKIEVAPFSRPEADIVCHYTDGKKNPRTTQWQDCCRRAGIPIDTDLRLDWQPVNVGLINKVRRVGRPLVLVLIPRAPMDRHDGFARELLPDCERLQQAIDALRARGARVVQVGSGDALRQFSGLDLDLKNSTSVTDLIDLAFAADALLGYVSFFVPLAESLRLPGLFVWSRQGLASDTEYIRTITPQKIIHRPDLLRAVIDDCPEQELDKAVDALLEQVRARPVLRG